MVRITSKVRICKGCDQVRYVNVKTGLCAECAVELIMKENVRGLKSKRGPFWNRFVEGMKKRRYHPMTDS